MEAHSELAPLGVKEVKGGGEKEEKMVMMRLREESWKRSEMK